MAQGRIIPPDAGGPDLPQRRRRGATWIIAWLIVSSALWFVTTIVVEGIARWPFLLLANAALGVALWPKKVPDTRGTG